MKALVFHGPGDVRYDEVPDPHLADDRGVIVRVTRASICGSDLHIYHGEGFSPEPGYVVGHEAVGEIVEVGAQVDRVRVGQRVLVPASVGCTRCAACGRGEVGQCTTRSGSLEKCYGLSAALPGSQAQYLAVPDGDVNCVPIPDGVDDDAAVTLTDATATAHYGLRRARPRPGESIAVVGLGPIGQMAASLALLQGASAVYGIDPVAERRDMAEAAGIIPVAVPTGAAGEQGTAGAEGAAEVPDPVRVIRAATDGGVHAAVEAVGADATIRTAQRVVRRQGRVSVVGVNRNHAFPFHMELAQVKELEFAIGLCSVQAELPTLLPLVASGRLDPGRIVTHRLPLSAGREAYALMDTRAEGVCKITLDPWAV
ncbi:alcohol dehydrogenase catalytic domain-containing protein [Brevibacterium litoralis]|uniref:alcohol dehydrogenase catalytic domain-containing protein n=1 Tax=Brevibacterium litoralis TaxID=3138935 RepID=UPI0032F04C1D